MPPKQPTTPPRQDPGNSPSFARGLALATGPETAERPYLGDYDTIEGLVRTMLAEELARAVDKGTGQLSDEHYGEQTLASVRRMARIFTGRDVRYQALAGWHTAASLPGTQTLATSIAQRLAGLVAPESLATPQQAAEALFSVALLEWRDGIQAFSRSGDETQLQQLGAELSENYARLLLGLPADDDEPDL